MQAPDDVNCPPGLSARLECPTIVPGHGPCTRPCRPRRNCCPPQQYCGDDAAAIAAARNKGTTKYYNDEAEHAAQHGAVDEEQQEQGDDDGEDEWQPPSGFTPDDDAKKTTRRYLIEFRWSFAGAAANPSQVEWQVTQGMYYAFQKRPANSEPGSAKREGDLGRALLLDGKVYEVRNTSPTTVLVQFAGMRGNRYTAAGMRAPLWILGNSNIFFQEPQTIFVPGDEIYSLRLKKYHDLTEEKIGGGVWGDPASPYAFVSVQHPVSQIVRRNQEKLGVDLSSMMPVEGNYRFRRDLIKHCQDVLRRGVLDKMPFTQLQHWKVKLERADGLPWDSPQNIADLAENDEIEQDLMTRTNVTTIDLGLTFMLLSPNLAEKTPKAAPAQK